MDVDLVAEPGAKDLLKGSSILAAIKASGVEYILSVPDITTSGGLLRPIARDPDLKLIRVCKEDECIGIASRALLLRQARAEPDPAHRLSRLDQRHPRRRGRIQAADLHDDRAAAAQSGQRRRAIRTSYGVRIIEPILDAMGIPHHYIGEEADVAKIKPAIDQAYEKSFPVALLVGRRPSLS